MSGRPAASEHRDQALMNSTKHTELLVGASVQATVTGFTEYAAILSLATGHIAYLYTPDISWLNRHVPPAELLRYGETFNVQITKLKKTAGGHTLISVSRKALLPDPWQHVITLHPIGSHFNARIIKFMPFGAYAQLETGFIGLLHNDELSWTKVSDKRKPGTLKGEKVQSYFAIGDTIPVMIQHADAIHHKLWLSYRQTLANPWQSIERDYPVGTRLVGYVDNIVKFGLFVRLPNRCHGLLHRASNKTHERVLASR